MATPIQNFIGRFSKNQVRTTNLFELEVTSGYSDVDDVLQYMTMHGENFTLPNRQQEFVDMYFKGYPVPVPTVMKMEQSHTITVRADSDGEVRRAFLAWAAKTADPAISDGSVFAGDRRLNTAGVIRIKLLSSVDNTTVTEVYKMVGVKIDTVSGFQVSHDNAAIATFDVSFRSIYWEIEPGTVKSGAFPDQK